MNMSIDFRKYKFLAFVIFIILIMPAQLAFPKTKKIHNFPIYNLDKKRFVIYKLLQSLPQNGFLILNFTSVYCAPCKQEIPELLTLQRKYENRINIFFIYSEYDKNLIKKDTKKVGIKNIDNVCIDLFSTIKKEFGIRGVPYTIIIDKNKNIKAKFDGFREKNIQEIDEIIKIK